MQLKLLTVLLGLCAIGGCSAKTPAPILERTAIVKVQSGVTFSYVVRSGDTIYAIAKLHGLTVKQVADANNIAPPYIIKPGQVLFIQSEKPSASDQPIVASAPEEIPLSNKSSDAADGRAGGAKVPSLVPGPVIIKPPIVTPIPESSSTSSNSKTVDPEPPKKVTVFPSHDPSQFKDGWQWPVSSSPQRDFTQARKGIDYQLLEGEEIVAASAGEVVYAGTGTLKYKHLIIVESNDGFLAAYEFNTDLNIRHKTIVKQGDRLALIETPSRNDSNESHRRFHFAIWNKGAPINPKTVILK